MVFFPPASLQSNDPPKVFPLTLTTAYNRDQFLLLGHCEEMERFMTTWRWRQKWGRAVKEPGENEAALHYKTPSSPVKRQLPWQNRFCCFIRRTSSSCFFQASEDLKSEALMSSCQFSVAEYLVFQKIGQIWACFLKNQCQVGGNAFNKKRGGLWGISFFCQHWSARILKWSALFRRAKLQRDCAY